MPIYVVEANGAYSHHVPSGNVAWGPKHFQSADSLTQAERAMFGVHVLSETAKPSFDPMTHQIAEGTPVKIAGTWTQVWDVTELSAPDKTSRLAQRKYDMKNQAMDLREQHILGGVTFNGTLFQSRQDDQTNVAGATLLATLAIINGVQPNDLRWHGGATDFGWIAEDNSVVPMDAFTVIDFGKAVAAHKSNCIFYAYALKAQIDAAADHAALDAIDLEAGWPE